jgi:hypothetical protein
MGIILLIGVLMMQAMHNSIGIGTNIGRSHGEEATNKKKSFPKNGHTKMLVCSVAVMKKGLKKQRCIPVYNEERDN